MEAQKCLSSAQNRCGRLGKVIERVINFKDLFVQPRSYEIISAIWPYLNSSSFH